MNDDIKRTLSNAEAQMAKAMTHLETELGKIRTGKANPSMLDGIKVDYYGTPTPLSQVANINTQDARTLVIQPWEKSLIDAISKAIIDANLGVNPQNDGALIRLSLPALTEDRRKDLVKKAKAEGEHCKVSIRNIRKEANEAVKRFQKNGLPEDEAKEAETKIQTLTDNFSGKCDKHLELKEKEIMTV